MSGCKKCQCGKRPQVTELEQTGLVVHVFCKCGKTNYYDTPHDYEKNRKNPQSHSEATANLH